MTLHFHDEFIDRFRAEGLAQGMAEGKVQGMAEGMAEGKVQGMAEGMAEGMAQGIAQGEAQILLRVFSARGLAVPPEIRELIQSCTSTAQLEMWAERAATAYNISAVFGDQPFATAPVPTPRPERPARSRGARKPRAGAPASRP